MRAHAFGNSNRVEVVAFLRNKPHQIGDQPVDTFAGVTVNEKTRTVCPARCSKVCSQREKRHQRMGRAHRKKHLAVCCQCKHVAEVARRLAQKIGAPGLDLGGCINRKGPLPALIGVTCVRPAHAAAGQAKSFAGPIRHVESGQTILCHDFPDMRVIDDD